MSPLSQPYNKESSVLACSLEAIPHAGRARYHELVAHLRTAFRARTELADGYTFRLDEQSVVLTQIAEWISMERLCCPFLTFHLEITGGTPDCHLTLTGPPGVKTILDAEFPFPPSAPLA